MNDCSLADRVHSSVAEGSVPSSASRLAALLEVLGKGDPIDAAVFRDAFVAGRSENDTCQLRGISPEEYARSINYTLRFIRQGQLHQSAVPRLG